MVSKSTHVSKLKALISFAVTLFSPMQMVGFLMMQLSYCFYDNCFQMIPEGEGQEPSVSWARYQMAVTKYKEDEKRSSSMYAIWDGAEPVVNFQNFINDNEAIDDVVRFICIFNFLVPFSYIHVFYHFVQQMGHS